MFFLIYVSLMGRDGFKPLQGRAAFGPDRSWRFGTVGFKRVSYNSYGHHVKRRMGRS